MDKTAAIPQWSLADLAFDDPAALEAALSQLEALLTELEGWRERLAAGLKAEEFLHLLHTQEQIHEVSAQLGAYAYLKFAVDTQNPSALSLRAQVEQVLTGVDNRAMFFSLWFKSLPEDAAGRYISAAGELRHYLETLRLFKPYTLSEAEEKIINIKDLNGNQALVKIYEIVTNAFTFHIKIEGEEQQLTRDGLTRYYHHPSPDVRSAAYQELYRVYGENKTALAQIYASLVGDWRAEEVDLRGYASPISARNLANQLPDAVVDTLLQVCRQNTGIFQRYFQLKARLVGMDRLRRYDVYAPVARSEKSIEFDTAVQLVLDSFRQFSPRFSQAASHLLERSHVDAQPRQGKRGGAFSYSVTPGLDPWVLVNFNERIRDVSTLAHELGHSVHTILARNHSVLTFHAPLPLAETASVFSEMLVTDRLLQEEPDPAVQRDLLMTILDDAYATVQRQAFIAIFEKDAHAKIAAGCTSDELADHYLQNLSEQFGESIELSGEFSWEWLTIPHIFNSPFYTYAYSFGQLLVLALYQQYLREQEAFVPRYLKLLSYGGSAEPQAILAEAGMDISSPEFWEGGFAVLQNKLERLEQISGGPV